MNYEKRRIAAEGENLNKLNEKLNNYLEKEGEEIELVFTSRKQAEKLFHYKDSTLWMRVRPPRIHGENVNFIGLTLISREDPEEEVDSLINEFPEFEKR